MEQERQVSQYEQRLIETAKVLKKEPIRPQEAKLICQRMSNKVDEALKIKGRLDISFERLADERIYYRLPQDEVSIIHGNCRACLREGTIPGICRECRQEHVLILACTVHLQEKMVPTYYLNPHIVSAFVLPAHRDPIQVGGSPLTMERSLWHQHMSMGEYRIKERMILSPDIMKGFSEPLGMEGYWSDEELAHLTRVDEPQVLTDVRRRQDFVSGMLALLLGKPDRLLRDIPGQGPLSNDSMSVYNGLSNTAVQWAIRRIHEAPYYNGPSQQVQGRDIPLQTLPSLHDQHSDQKPQASGQKRKATTS